MITGKKKLPIGIESFEEIRRLNFYYIDKTGLIRDLLADWGKVNLFTRPRRFGKTLNMNMLADFFDICKNSREIFKDLKISSEDQLCSEWMNQYPVLFISFKDVFGDTFETAYNRLAETMSELCKDHTYLETSAAVDKDDLARFKRIKSGSCKPIDIDSSLNTLMRMMKVHFDKPVILLLDEYDVPLAKANDGKFYDAMLDVIRGIMSRALKGNSVLKFAVVTGCLRVSKESIFTGINNFNVNTITDISCDEYFGFTDDEVRLLLSDYGMMEHYDEVREWYNGYRFGNASVYCPWDVINYARDLLKNEYAKPKMYWINTSGNSIVKRLILKANKNTRNEIEQLIAGGSVKKTIKQELTYREIEDSIDNIWSVLFMSGYLTTIGETDGRVYNLVIPNKEVHEIFTIQIWEWFHGEVVDRNPSQRNRFCNAFKTGDGDTIQQLFTTYLKETISIRDTYIRKEKKENFYQGILLGLLKSEEDWIVRSNAEAGDGFSDIILEIDDEIGCVIEVKYAEERAFDTACIKAMKQINDMNYTEELKEAGMTVIYEYGIACFKKGCKVVCRKIEVTE